jgi:hypothetical protein
MIQIAKTIHVPIVWFPITVPPVSANPWHIDSSALWYSATHDWWTTGLAHAFIGDHPGAGANTEKLIQYFETCAVCADGEWGGVVFGCVQWGHRIELMLSGGAIPLPKYFVKRWGANATDTFDTGWQLLPGTTGHANWGAGMAPTSTWESLARVALNAELGLASP